MKKQTFITSITLLAPFFAFAANLDTLLQQVKNTLDIVIPLAITIALIYFIWGVIQYVIASDEENKAKARQQMIWGIIGLFVIVAVWGIVNFIGTYLGITPGTDIGDLPGVPDL
jgi:uncharacterized membrane protein